MRYLIIFLYLIFNPPILFANEILLKNCKGELGGANVEFRVLEKNNLVIEYWETSKTIKKWPIKIYENNYIESVEKSGLGDKKIVLKMFVDKRQVQIIYSPGRTFNYKCR